jgi:hypothetical protein
MPKSQRLRFEDVQAVWRLLSECRELGADNQAGPQHFVAARLGISITTVHSYVTALYRHFRVAGRAELLAWFVRRAYPNGVLPEDVQRAPK